jgi:hypothetical protein
MISPKDKIIIAGDSWGCGEWEDLQLCSNAMSRKILHGGLAQFLTEYGCEVVNVSQAGGSNSLSLDQLTDAIRTVNADYIFWFQTDPMRDLRPHNSKTLPQSIKDMVRMGEKLLNDTYNSLNNLDVKIHCIGGVTELNDSIRKYSNLIPLVPSIIKMFGGEQPRIWVSEWIGVDHLTFTDEFLTELENLPPLDLPKKWFYPDGVHPNRYAHWELFQYILKQHV